MKLPELKERLKNKYIVRVVAGVLTIALVGTGIGATAVFADKNNSTEVTSEASSGRWSCPSRGPQRRCNLQRQ